MPEAPTGGCYIPGPAEFARVFGVSRETLDRLSTYEALLRKWQATINLVAPSTLDEVWHRHFADSAQLLAHIPDGAKRIADLGSGAGFPGLVLAILSAEAKPGKPVERQFTLIESDTRKAAFLAEVARKTGVAVDIRAERIEKLSTQVKVAPVDVAIARALAPLSRLLGMMAPLLGKESLAVLLKGRDALAELEEARTRWDFLSTLHPSLTEAGAHVITIRNLQAKTEG